MINKRGNGESESPYRASKTWDAAIDEDFTMNFKRHYLIVGLISFGFYTLSMFLGSIINVFIIYSAGYENYSQFSMDGTSNSSVTAAILIVAIINHVIFSLLTANLIGKYTIKQGCLDNKYFRFAAIIVFVFAAIIYPIVLSSNSGWLTYLIHIVGILLFGGHIVSSRSAAQIQEETVIFPQNTDVTRAVSFKLNKSNGHATPMTGTEAEEIRFCHMCGAKITPDSIFCNQCGTRIR